MDLAVLVALWALSWAVALVAPRLASTAGGMNQVSLGVFSCLLLGIQ